MRLTPFALFYSLVGAFDLSNMLAGEYIREPSSGLVSASLVNLGEVLQKRDYEDVPPVKINSLDNANTLEAIKNQIENNMELGTGERLYMESVFLHNGYSQAVNDLTTGEFADYLYSFKSLNSDNIAVLLNNTYDSKVKALLKGAHFSAPRTFAKRDRLVCDGNNLTGSDGNHCGTLMDRIGGRGCISGAWCVGRCCATWDDHRCYNDDVVNGLVQRCRDGCIFNSRSCKIIGANMAGFTRNFCLSSRAVCK